MTPKEYKIDHNLKDLSDKQILEGKKAVTIKGTKIPMPFDEVYTRIMGGMSLDDIDKIYGRIKLIVKWAVHDNIEPDGEISSLVDDEIENRRKFDMIERNNPTVAKTIKEMVNEYAPDVTKKVAILSGKLLDKGLLMAQDEETTSSDILNIAKAMQTITDVTGDTDRHAKTANVNLNMGQGGTEFVIELDEPPIEAIEVDDVD